MAIYHCNCKIISRGQGRSAVGASAYRSGEKLTNEYDGMTHDYTRKQGVVYSEIMLCENAPQEYQKRSTLWNEVEKIEKGSRAQLAREYEVGLPIELSRKEQIQLVRDFVKENFADKGMCVDFSIHDKELENPNPHAHILLTTRPIEIDGTWGAKATNEYVLDKNGERILQKIDKQNRKIYKRVKKDTTDWNTKDFLNKNRESWAVKINAELERKGLPQRVDHRSYKEQGIEKIPTIHEGGARNLENRGIETDRGNINREIKKANGQMQTIDILARQTEKEIANIREDISWNRHHEEIAKIEAQLPKAAGNKKVLLSVQAGLLKLYEQAKRIEPTKTSEGRTVEYDGRNVPHFEYHKNKLLGDISFIQKNIDRYLEAIREKEQPAQKQKQGEFVEMKQKRPLNIDYIERIAKELARLRNEFIKETIQSTERTNYQPNPIYNRQANEIKNLSKIVVEQSHTIEALKNERSEKGIFKGKEKKDLEIKIENFIRLREGNIQKLKELGVTDPFHVEKTIKEKQQLAAQEQVKAAAAKQNDGAGIRAAEAKRLYIELAKTVPVDQQKEILSKIEDYKEHGEKGIKYFQAEIEAKKQLDRILKPEMEKTPEHEKIKGIEREH